MRLPPLLLLLLLLPSCDRATPAPPPPVPPPAPPAPVFDRKVSLQVDAKTWIQGGRPNPIEALLRGQLAQAKIQVVGADDASRDATLLAAYEESKGTEYASMYGMGGSVGHGTNIRLELTLLSKEAETLLKHECTASTPSSVSTGSLHQAAWEAFSNDPGLTLAGDFVGASLGIKRCAPRLLPALFNEDHRDRCLELLKKTGFEPRTADEKARLAIATKDWEGCVAIGAGAVDALLEWFNGIHWPDKAGPAAKALGRIGDSRAAKPLLERLRSKQGSLPGSSEDLEHFRDLIEALGGCDPGYALAELQELAKHERPSIAAAARDAVARIKERLTVKK